MPKAYLIANADVTDPDLYEVYKSHNPAIFERHGGRFLVRGGTQKMLEGSGRSRSVVVEFPSLEAAQAAYDDPEYLINRDRRIAASEMNFLMVVEGAD